jgi:hypothetical protein
MRYHDVALGILLCVGATGTVGFALQFPWDTEPQHQETLPPRIEVPNRTAEEETQLLWDKHTTCQEGVRVLADKCQSTQTTQDCSKWMRATRGNCRYYNPTHRKTWSNHE